MYWPSMYFSIGYWSYGYWPAIPGIGPYSFLHIPIRRASLAIR
jgi:hypothetical protein